MASETVVNAIYAVIAAAVGIFIYVWWAFRNVPSPFRYGAAAIVALLHDTIIVIGMFAILGVLLEIEVGTMFLIALLTVIGYSVNDTIVVFDRIRENVTIHPNRELSEVVNLSISETIGRSLNTSLTLLVTLLALYLFGGTTIREFLLVLLVGVVAGTYSSIAVASQVLISWEYGDIPWLFGRGSQAESRHRLNQRGVSTTLPVACLDVTRLTASAASSSGNSACTTGWTDSEATISIAASMSGRLAPVEPIDRCVPEHDVGQIERRSAALDLTQQHHPPILGQAAYRAPETWLIRPCRSRRRRPGPR